MIKLVGYVALFLCNERSDLVGWQYLQFPVRSQWGLSENSDEILLFLHCILDCNCSQMWVVPKTDVTNTVWL